MKKLKRTGLVILGLIAVFAVYVEIVNRNATHMTYRQKILRAVYPAFMWWNRVSGKNRALSHAPVTPPVPFYSLKAQLNNGDTFDFANLKGKKVLLVNTASDCGYTGQYEALQALSQRYPDRLLVIGFPANDFKEQEKGSDAEIAQFCRLNYGVRFPLMKKSVVIRSDEQNPVYRWLTDPSQNGWNRKAPAWNFSKYLVDEEGRLLYYFGPSVSPLSDAVKKAID